jgi:HK97 family phage major capsid protein
MSDELKKGLQEVQAAFAAFTKANDERLKTIETKGTADPQQTEKVAKLEALVATKDAEYKAKLEAIEVAMKRTQQGPENKGGPSQESKAQTDAFMRLVRKGEGRLTEVELKTLQVSDDSQGGYLVPVDMTGRIIQKIFETSPMRQYASIATISTDSLEGSVDVDECEGGYVGEMQPRNVTGNPTIGKWAIPVHELYAQPKTTQKVLDDAAYDLEGWLIRKAGEKLARIENSEFVNGSNKIRGFLSYDIVTTLSGDDYTAKRKVQYIKTGVSGGFAATPNAGDVLIDAQMMLKDQYRAKAAWAMNRLALGEVRKLKDSEGRYLWAPGIEAGKPSTLLGMSIAEFNNMPNIGANSLSIALADWSEAYQIVDRQGLTILRNPYLIPGFVLFYTRRRTGGDVLNFEALKLIKFAA